MDTNDRNEERSNTNQQWTEREMALLEEHYRNFTAAEIQERFLPGRSTSAIYGKAQLLKLQQTYTHWTDEDTATLREVYLVEGAEGVHQRLPHYTRSAIWGKAWYLGLRRSTSTRTYWSGEECQQLIKNMHLPLKELRALFPQYSSAAIERARQRQRLRWKNDHEWSQEERDVLKQHYRYLSTLMLQRRFFPMRLWTDIKQQVSGLKGEAPPTKPSKWSEEECDILRQHYPTLGSRRVQQHYLPHRTQKAIKFRARVLDLRTEVHREWTPEELQILKDVYLQGAARAVQAMLPHRSQSAIRSKAGRLGLSEARERPVTAKKGSGSRDGKT